MKNKLKEIKEPNDLHLEYFKMTEAWSKFQNAVEANLLPFTKP